MQSRPRASLFVKSRRKALVRSERALKQLKSWASTRVVKAIVRASATSPEPPTSPPGRPGRARGAYERHHGADPDDPDPHLRVDHTVGEPPRRPAHDVVGRRVHAERERGRAVGEEVDPEDLRREQRHRDRLAVVIQAERAARARRRRTSCSTSPMFDESRKRRNLRMFAKMPRPSRIALDDRGEVVVGEDHVRRLAGDVGAGDAHRDADVRRLERGSVVDAVARHRDDPPVRVERVDDPQLVLGRDAGVDRGVPHERCARVLVVESPRTRRR